MRWRRQPIETLLLIGETQLRQVISAYAAFCRQIVQRCLTDQGKRSAEVGQDIHLTILNYFFFPVTSSHFSPRSFLISSTFFQASSFIWTNDARAAA